MSPALNTVEFSTVILTFSFSNSSTTFLNLTCFTLIFWIQNIGLWLFPLLIGKVLENTNPGVDDPVALNYTWPLVMLACLGVAALIIGIILKAVDKKKHLGLEEPNIK